ncbi:MAG: hypothetical protein K0S75_1718 [Clostridia bacterium]|jgi:hypothetical protein|nr:hypothetical protein [Clostridia bacterium]
MKWLNKLERVLGRFAIRNLMTYIVMLNAVAFVLIYLDLYVLQTGILYSKMVLIPQLVLRGEIWRLVTFLAIPPSFSLMWVFFTLYFYYMVGGALESEWGTFKFNAYYFLGILATIAVSFIFNVAVTPIYINLSLFLAFARIYPNYELLIFFVLPVKVKYLALIDWAFIAFTILVGSMSSKLTAIISIINFFIFFGPDILSGAKGNRQVHQNRQRFRREIPKDLTYHKCTICGKTEKDDPALEFRYCDKCEGDYEYCMEHVKNHEHISKPSNVIEFRNKQE